MRVGAWRLGAMALCCALATRCTEWSSSDPLVGGWTTTGFSGSSYLASDGIASMSYTMNFHGDGASVATCENQPDNCGTFTASLTINYANDAPQHAGCTFAYAFRGYVWISNWQNGSTVSLDGTSGRESFGAYGNGAGSTLTVTNCLAASSNQATTPDTTYAGEVGGGSESFEFNGATAVASGDSATEPNETTATFTYGPIDDPP